MQPSTLPEQANAVEHLPTQLPAIPAQVTLPDAAAEHIATLDFSHLPDWFPLVSAAQAASHVPTEIPPPPPVDVTLPDAAVSHLPDAANIPDWLLPLV
jgi:hypothetical protein